MDNKGTYLWKVYKTGDKQSGREMQFRDAIVRQLMVQMQGIDAELTGDGIYTEQGDVVYIFTISEADVVTKQYYIVGEQQYCLIHLTSFSGSESAESAVQSMVDSFIWNEGKGVFDGIFYG